MVNQVSNLVKDIVNKRTQVINKRNSKFSLTFISDNIIECAGFTASFLLEKNNFQSYVHDKDWQEVNNLFRTSIGKGSLNLTYRFLSKDGSYIQVEENLVAVKNQKDEIIEYVGVMNVSNGLLAKINGINNRDIIQEYFCETGTLLVITGKNGEILDINHAGCQILKRNKDELIGKNWFKDIIYFSVPPGKLKKDNNFLPNFPLNKKVECYIRQESEQRTILGTKHFMIKNEFNIPIGFIIGGEDISHLVKTREELMRKEEQYRNISESSNSVIFEFNQNYQVTYANSSFTRIIGFEEDIIQNKVLKDFFTEQDYKDVEHDIQELVTNGYSLKTIWNILTKKNTIKTFICTLNQTQHKNSILVTAEDITEILNVLENIQYDNQLYRILAGNIPHTMMLLLDRNCKIILCEGPETKNLNLDKKQVEQKHISEINNNEFKVILDPLYNKLMSGKEISKEIKIGSSYYLLWLIPVKNEKKEVITGMVILNNITHEKAVTIQLNKAKEMAEEANQAKSDFIANMSHEIRTPLNAIVGFSEQLLKTKLNKIQLNFAQIIDKSAEHLFSLVDEILSLSKIETGQIPLENIPINVKDILNELYESLKIKADKNGLEFRFNYDKKIDTIVLGDPVRLKQILINLLNNAIKFTEKGYVELQCKIKNEKGKKLYLEFQVKDSGIGIPREKLPEIFEKFKQADPFISRQYGGSGLGLTIVKKLVDLMHGEIHVKSTLHMGSDFTIILPFSRTEDKNLLESQFGYRKNLLKGVKVLLVDDDVVNRLLGEVILKDFECETDTAINGLDAKNKINKNHYDIILLDIRMPDITGFEVSKYIRFEKKDNDTKIIAVTAGILKDDINRCQKSGMDDYLLKPFKEVDLYNKICKALKLKKGYILKEREKMEKNKPTVIYNLDELEKITRDNQAFFNQMIRTFIDNSQEGVQKLNEYKKSGSWKNAGEIAHKLLPSFKHLEIKNGVNILTDIKINGLEGKKTESIPFLIDQITEITNQVNEELEQKIK